MPSLDRNDVLAAMVNRWPDFYRQFTPLTPQGGEWRGPCPLHGGDGPNFSVNPENGLWTCFTDCQDGGDVFDFLSRKEGLDFPDALAQVAAFAGTSAFAEASAAARPSESRTARPKAARPAPRRLVETYDYADEEGALLFQVVRYDPKGFSQRRPAEGGTWAYSLDGVRRVLYRLPEVLAAAVRPVFVCEGEKDADALAALGLCATTAPMGAGKWDAAYTEALCGAGVVILPDNDPAGRDGARHIARELHGRSKRTRVVELPGLPEKGDVSDWLAAGGTKDALLSLVKATPNWEPEPDWKPEPAPAPLGQADGNALPSWEPPVPFSGHALPVFPVEALPDALAGMVAEAAASIQVAPDFPAMLALAVVAAASARRCLVRVGQTHSEPLNLFVAVTGEPGERKTAAVEALAQPLRDAEREMVAQSVPAQAAAQEARAVQEARLLHLRGQAAKEKDSAQVAQLVRELGEEAAALTEVPPLPRLLADDVTPEKLASLMSEQGGTMAILSAEGGIFGILAGRYSDGKANLDLFLKGHAGEDVRVDRKGGPPVHIPRACLTMGLTVQPDVLTSLSDTPSFRGRGLLGRFLYSLPGSLVGTRLYQDRPVAAAARSRYNAAILSILALPQADPEDPGACHALRLDGEALALWAEHTDAVERRMVPGGDLSGVRDWASKLAGAVARIAGGFHLVENAYGKHPWDTSISPETVLAAWAVGEYLIPHALAAFGVMGADPALALARRLLAWAEREARPEFSLRDCHRANRSVGSPRALEPALTLLCERGYLRLKAAPKHDRRGQPPSPLYELNPLGQNGQNGQNTQK